VLVLLRAYLLRLHHAQAVALTHYRTMHYRWHIRTQGKGVVQTWVWSPPPSWAEAPDLPSSIKELHQCCIISSSGAPGASANTGTTPTGLGPISDPVSSEESLVHTPFTSSFHRSTLPQLFVDLRATIFEAPESDGHSAAGLQAVRPSLSPRQSCSSSRSGQGPLQGKDSDVQAVLSPAHTKRSSTEGRPSLFQRGQPSMQHRQQSHLTQESAKSTPSLSNIHNHAGVHGSSSAEVDESCSPESPMPATHALPNPSSKDPSPPQKHISPFNHFSSNSAAASSNPTLLPAWPYVNSCPASSHHSPGSRSHHPPCANPPRMLSSASSSTGRQQSAAAEFGGSSASSLDSMAAMLSIGQFSSMLAGQRRGSSKMSTGLGTVLSGSIDAFMNASPPTAPCVQLPPSIAATSTRSLRRVSSPSTGDCKVYSVCLIVLVCVHICIYVVCLCVSVYMCVYAHLCVCMHVYV